MISPEQNDGAGTYTAYYWRGKPNFGDLLTPLLLEHYDDLIVSWAPAASADVICVGSILEALPAAWPGVVCGSGKMFEQTQPLLSNATVLALRGPLTARGVAGTYALGDPGLLADELVTVEKEYPLGLVPHWSDTQLEHRFSEYHPRIIRPSADPLEVLREIGRCRKIVSSSLHGIILADAFDIPRRIELAAQLVHEGGDFKFRDHNAAVRLPHKIGVTQRANRYVVQDLQHELYEALLAVRRSLETL